MIPKNIEKEHILKAIEKIERTGIPKGRSSKKFILGYRGKHYPPKYVIYLADKYVSGKELDSSESSGGQETNNFLKRLGFDIVEASSSLTFDRPISAKNKTFDTLRDFVPELEGLEPTVRLYSKEMQWCGLSPEKPEALAKFRELIENRRKRSRNWVATVILQSNGKYSNSERLKALSQIVDLVAKETDGDGVILFPAGWFDANKQEARSLYKWAEKNVRKILAKNKGNIFICLGIDGKYDKSKDQSKDQIAIAISKRGIRAIGRKFHPTKDEKDIIKTANDCLSIEEGKTRIFSLNGKEYFLAVCYDGFGIRQRGIPNFGIDVILDLVHGFYPKGKAASGEAYFARDGFAGASREWGCLVFGAAVFFKREIPERWPSGVRWNQDKKSTKNWKYKYNPIKPIKIKKLPNIKEGIASIRIYDEVIEKVLCHSCVSRNLY